MEDRGFPSSNISEISWVSSALHSFSVNGPKLLDEEAPISLSPAERSFKLPKKVFREFPKSTNRSCVGETGMPISEKRLHENLDRRLPTDSWICQPSKYAFSQPVSVGPAHQVASRDNLCSIRGRVPDSNGIRQNSRHPSNSMPEENQKLLYSTTITTNSSLPGVKARKRDQIGPKPKETQSDSFYLGLTCNRDVLQKAPWWTKCFQESPNPKPELTSLSSTASRKSFQDCLLKPSVSDIQSVDTGLPIPPLLSPVASLSETARRTRLDNPVGFQLSHIKMVEDTECNKSLGRKCSCVLCPRGPADYESYHSVLDGAQSPNIYHLTNLQRAIDLVEHVREQILETREEVLQPGVKEIVWSSSPAVKMKGHMPASFDSVPSVRISPPIPATSQKIPPSDSELATSQALGHADLPLLRNTIESSHCRSIHSDQTFLGIPVHNENENHVQENSFSSVTGLDSKSNILLSNSPTTENKKIKPRDALGPPKPLKLDHIRPGIMAGSDSYASIKAQGPSAKNPVFRATSTSINASKVVNPILGDLFENPTPRGCYERTSTSLAGSSRGFDTASKYQDSVSLLDSSDFDSPGSIPHRYTIRWLKDILSRNGPYESQLTALPSRSVPSMDFDTLPFGIDPRPESLELNSLKTERGQRDNDIPEALTNTINDLEHLMNEALLLARRVIEGQESINYPSILDDATKVLKSSRADITRYLNRTISTDDIFGEFQSDSEDSESNLTDEFETVDSVEEEKLRRDDIDAIDRPKSNSGWSPSGCNLNPYLLTSLILPEGNSGQMNQTSSGPRSTENYRGAPRRRDTDLTNNSCTNLQADRRRDKNNPGCLSSKSLEQEHTPEAKFDSVNSLRHLPMTRLTQAPVYHSSAAKQEDIPLEFSEEKLQPHNRKTRLTTRGSNAARNKISNNIYYGHEKISTQKIPIIQDSKRHVHAVNHNFDGSTMPNSDEIKLSNVSGVRDHAKGKEMGISSRDPFNLKGGPGISLHKLGRSNDKKQRSPVISNENQLERSDPVDSRKNKTIARDWPSRKKRPVAAVACFSTALVGIIVGIYAGETPAIQYYIVDLHHYTVLGNVFFFFGLAIPTFLAWPFPLYHGRKPYILGAMSLAMPLLFVQALAVNDYRSPNVSRWRVGLLLSRALMGFCLGFANMNFKSMLTDLFGASLQSTNPYQEHVDEFDVRRHGGGTGVWLGLWTWSALGSIGLGFLIGALIIESLPPTWGFYISIIIIAFVMLLNIICPELRRSGLKRSVANVVTENVVSRRSTNGKIKTKLAKSGPKWWREELYYGINLSQKMIRQPGFVIMTLYMAWIYGQQVLIIVLVGALMSNDYHFRSPMVGLSAMAIPIGALVAVPFQKASLFSRSRRRLSINDDSILSQRKIHWSSHMLRRAIFVLFLPLFGLIFTLLCSGPPIPFILPLLAAGAIGFLSDLAMAECNGIVMEVFDISDIRPYMTSSLRDSPEDKSTERPTNYSSFPRVCSAFAIIETFGYIFAAGTSGVGGVLTRRLGQQAATGVMAGILLILSILLLASLVRYTEVQIIPDSKMEQMNRYHKARWEYKLRRETGLGETEEPWRPSIIGNPHKSTRKMCLLELGSLSRYSEIMIKNRLIDETGPENENPNYNNVDFPGSKAGQNNKQSISRSSSGSPKSESLEQSDPSRYREMPNTRNESNNSRGKSRGGVTDGRET